MAIEIEVGTPTIRLEVTAVVGAAESGGGGVTDHGDLDGLADDDHTQYALADGSRGSFAAAGHDHSGTYEPSGTVATHSADTTNVHGITDTSALETTTGAQAKVDAHVNDTSAAHAATAISVDASGFNGNLTTGDDTVQEVAQKVDDLVIPSAYTDEMARDAIGTALTAGTGITKTVDDGADTITLASVQRQIHISGQYNCTAMRREGATNYTASRLNFTPFIVSATTTFDRIAVNHEATVAAAASVGRLGIYSHGASGPDALILDAGTIALDTAAAFKSVTISQQLTPGIYWLAFVSQHTGSNPTFTHGLPYLSVPSTDQTQGSKFQAGVTGALPSTASPGAANASGVIAIYMRAS